MRNFGTSTYIYTKPSCPYCIEAKRILAERGIQFTEVVIDGVSNTKQTMCADIGQELGTVPQVILNGKFIPGGCRGLKDHYKIA